VSARFLRQWAVGQMWWSAFWLVMSVIVSVAMLKMGREFVHPIGSVRGNATVRPSSLSCGSTTPSLGISGI